jgi:hypothetical protein
MMTFCNAFYESYLSTMPTMILPSPISRLLFLFFLLKILRFFRNIPFPCQPERLERCSPCWLLKLRGTQRVQMKGVLPWLVCWACRAGTSDFCPAYAALVGPVQDNVFLVELFQFM